MSLKQPTSGRRWSTSRRSDVGCHGSIERPVDAGNRRDSDVDDAAAGHLRAFAGPRARLAIPERFSRRAIAIYRCAHRLETPGRMGPLARDELAGRGRDPQDPSSAEIGVERPPGSSSRSGYVRPMAKRPADTTAEGWHAQREAHARLGPAGRVQVAVELSDAVREIQIEGLRARHPEWDRSTAVRHLIAAQFGIDLPKTS
jgi:hypothetical protein